MHWAVKMMLNSLNRGIFWTVGIFLLIICSNLLEPCTLVSHPIFLFNSYIQRSQKSQNGIQTMTKQTKFKTIINV